MFAVDFNGNSLASELLEVYACGLPRDFDPPVYVASDQSSITIRWDEPRIDGGCPIYDYLVERDEDGSGLNGWTEVNPIETYPRNDPHIYLFQCTSFPDASLLGSSFLFRITARNIQGAVVSLNSAKLYLASVPSKPLGAPVSDASQTNSQ